MEIKKIYTEKAPQAVGPYSQAVVYNGLVYTSGQIAINPETNTVEADDIKGQTEQIMKNLGEVLRASNSSFENAIKTVCFIADMNDFGAFNEVYAKYFTSKPARSCVAVKSIPKGLLCEVEIIADMSK